MVIYSYFATVIIRIYWGILKLMYQSIDEITEEMWWSGRRVSH
jgi:hypothetical protein